jgi:hypothetical protein
LFVWLYGFALVVLPGVWSLEFIKTHDAKEPRVVLGKGRSTENSAVPPFVPVRVGREERKIYIVMRLPIVRFLYASFGL